MVSDKITIDRMSDKNIDAVAKIEKACFTTPWSLKSLESELANPNALFYVAVISGEAVGYAGMYHVVDGGYITNIAVLPQYRRLGAAGLLLRALFDYAKSNGLEFITLEVRESNLVARYFYEKLGFYLAGRRRSFYTKPAEDGIIMTKEFLN